MINSSLKKPCQINSNKTSIYIYWVGWSLHLEQFIARLWIDCSLTIQTPSRHFVHMPRQPPFLTSAVFFVRRGGNRLVAPRRNVGRTIGDCRSGVLGAARTAMIPPEVLPLHRGVFQRLKNWIRTSIDLYIERLATKNLHRRHGGGVRFFETTAKNTHFVATRCYSGIERLHFSIH